MREKVGAVFLGLGVIIPGMIVTDFMPEWNVLPLYAWVGIAALGGAIGVALMSRLWAVGAAAGAIGGAGTLAAMMVYVPLRAELSESFFTAEFIIPAVVGGLPGWILYAVANRLLPERTPDHAPVEAGPFEPPAP